MFYKNNFLSRERIIRKSQIVFKVNNHVNKDSIELKFNIQLAIYKMLH